MNQEERERQQIINDYDTQRERLLRERKGNANIEAVLEALTPVIADNLAYFKYGEAKGWWTKEKFTEEGFWTKEKFTEEHRQRKALRYALTSVIGQAIKWSIQEAELLAFEILEDVNDHDNAHKVAEVLNLKV